MVGQKELGFGQEMIEKCCRNYYIPKSFAINFHRVYTTPSAFTEWIRFWFTPGAAPCGPSATSETVTSRPAHIITFGGLDFIVTRSPCQGPSSGFQNIWGMALNISSAMYGGLIVSLSLHLGPSRGHSSLQGHTQRHPKLLKFQPSLKWWILVL